MRFSLIKGQLNLTFFPNFSIFMVRLKAKYHLWTSFSSVRLILFRRGDFLENEIILFVNLFSISTWRFSIEQLRLCYADCEQWNLRALAIRWRPPNIAGCVKVKVRSMFKNIISDESILAIEYAQKDSRRGSLKVKL